MSATEKLQGVLAVVNAWENTGKAFFRRCSDSSMAVFVRDPRLWGGNPNVEHWANARDILEGIHRVTKNTSDIEIDRQSGTLLIRVNRIYPKA